MSAPYPTREIRSPEELREAMGASFTFSEQQWAAISAPLEPTVVVAGAGSGKTTLMAARVVWLVLTGQVRPEEVLGLTFTTKAAAELRQRIRASLVEAGVLPGPDEARRRTDRARGGDLGHPDEPDDVLEPTVLTYNAYAAALLTEHGLRIGHEPDTRVVTDAARYQLGARVVERHTEAVQHLTDHPPTAIQNLLALDGAMSEHLVGPADVRRVDAEARRDFERALAEERAGKARKTYVGAVEKALHVLDRRAELLGLVEDYRRTKADLGLMDFADQVALAARLVEDQPGVGEAQRGQFKVVLLDEYQDTSVAQARMLARLFSGPDPGRGRGHAVMAVGDPNQAIYGWRGASVSNILGFGTTFPAADGGEPPTLRLTVNRRSQRRILDVANRLAADLLARFPQVAPLEAKPEAGEGRVEVLVHETAADELAWLATAVHEAHGDGSTSAWSDVGVLVRDNSHAALVYDALTVAGVPVEIVGLSGLLRLPEVAQVVAVLHLLHDLTANASLLTLLAGPRWAVGPRDLALLARRAQELAGQQGRAGGEDGGSLQDELLAITDGVDPAEVVSLADALDDPGDRPFSDEARERFALLAAELRLLRAHAGEPLLDVVRRIVDVTGVDVELASAVGPAAAARRDNLDLFVKAVADFQAVDGATTLPALLAYLTAEDDQGNGLDLATPTAADSVKLLTVHRSKGLEWRHVFVVGACDTRFPSNRSRELWTSAPAVLPAPLRGDAADLPQLAGHDRPALEAYRAATRAHDALEELRLGYVALTRAAEHLAVSGFCWSATRASCFGPSPYQAVVREALEEWGEPPTTWRDKPAKDDPNPCASEDPSVPWPVEVEPEEAALRRAAAVLVRSAADELADGTAPDHDPGLDMLQVAQVAEWDAELERLLAEARQDRAPVVEVPLPAALSATAVSRLRDDPEAFARDLARPVPRRPSPAARFGTRFHAWVEARFGQQDLFDPEELPGQGDAGIDGESDLAALVAAFEAGPFADRAPHAVEAPFSLVLAGQVVRGRIDAVYAEPVAAGDGPDDAEGTDGADWLVVDWKTGREETADPLQLAVYRQAWAELVGCDPARVRAAFCFVRTGRVVEPDDLPDRGALEVVLGG